MEEARSLGSGPLPPVPWKSHKTGPQPLGPKTNCQVWNSKLPRGAGPGQGVGGLGWSWGLERLGWKLEGLGIPESLFMFVQKINGKRA